MEQLNKFLDELRALDTSDVGRWPFLFRALFVVIIFVIVTAASVYYFPIKNKTPLLEQAEAKEQELRQVFVARQRKAANFEAYKIQLAEIEQSFGAMLRQLPGKTEVPSLLVDISQTGLGAGLEEELFRPDAEIRRDFYAELPIKIRLRGTYHELAKFVSDIAALPRIVTIHDVELSSSEGDPELQMDLVAKTYRYLEDDEEQS